MGHTFQKNNEYIYISRGEVIEHYLLVACLPTKQQKKLCWRKDGDPVLHNVAQL